MYLISRSLFWTICIEPSLLKKASILQKLLFLEALDVVWLSFLQYFYSIHRAKTRIMTLSAFYVWAKHYKPTQQCNRAMCFTKRGLRECPVTTIKYIVYIPMHMKYSQYESYLSWSKYYWSSLSWNTIFGWSLLESKVRFWI